MRSMFASVIGAAPALVVMAVGAIPAIAAEPPAAPAVWLPYDMIVDLDGLPRRYSCNDLWSKFRDVLLTIGARPSMMIFPYRCDSLSPRVHLQFSLPSAVHGAQVRYATVRVHDDTVRLAPGRPRSLDASDCVLVRQIKGALLTAVPVQVRSYRFTCIAPPSRHPPFFLSLRALVPAPTNQWQVAAESPAGTRSGG